VSAAPPASWLASRAALPAAIALIAGIASHRLLPAAPGLWLLIIPILCCAAATFLGQSLASLCLLLATGLCGVVAAQLAVFYFPADQIGLFATNEPRLATVEVRLDSPPHVIDSDSGKRVPPRMEFTAVVRRIRTWTGWENASGDLLVSIGQLPQGIQEGQTLQLVGTLQRPLPADNPGQFDWARYDRSQRLLAELHVPHASGVRIIEQGSQSILPRVRGEAQSAITAGFSTTNAVEQELLTALVFGERGTALRDVEEAFRRTGNIYLLASNGLRVAVLAAGVYLLCILARLSPRKAVWIVTLAVALFGLLTIPTPQAIRPVLICAGVGIVIAGGRRTDPVQLLSLAAMAVLVVNPMDLYAAGFQLSFATTLGMMLLTPIVRGWNEEWDDLHRRAARDLLETSSWQRFRFAFAAHFRRAVPVALVAWVVTTPLVIFHFEQFNPWCVPIGLLLGPLVFICMIAGFLKIALTLAIPHLAPQWAAVALLPAALLNHAVIWFSKIPADDFPVTSPSPAVIFGAYLLICAPVIARLPLFNRLHHSKWSQTRWRWLARCAGPALGVALAIISSRQAARAPTGALQVTLLSVGAGQTAVAERPDGRVLLFDCGSTTLSDDMRQCLAPFLRHEGRTHVDAIYLSHGDFDHISAAAAAAAEYGVRDVYFGPNFRAHARESVTAESLLESLDQLKIIPQILWRGEQVDLGDGAKLSILWPPEVSTFNSNNSGVVMRLTFAGRSILFPADIQAPPERALLQQSAMLTSDVLVAPHHGSDEESTADFIRAVHPRFIVSSNADHLTQKQRTFDALPDARPLYRTSQCGALTITITPDGNLDLHGFLRLHEEHAPS
jgi:competence protein ComEC